MKYLLLPLFFFSFFSYGTANPCSKERSALNQARVKTKQIHAKWKQEKTKWLQAVDKVEQARIEYKKAHTHWEVFFYQIGRNITTWGQASAEWSLSPDQMKKQTHDKLQQAEALLKKSKAQEKRAYDKMDQAAVNLGQAGGKAKRAYNKLQKAEAQKEKAYDKWLLADDIYIACRDQADASL